jgi:hypothetical protein
MTFTLFAVLSILLVHFIVDFVVQTEWQATNKYKNIWALLSHTVIYTMYWLVFLFGILVMQLVIYEKGVGLFTVQEMYSFVGITFVVHTITDFFTSKLNKYILAKDNGKYRRFFVCIGFDQVLHYIQLFLCWYYLVKL